MLLASTVHREAPPTRNDLVPDADGAKAEKPCPAWEEAWGRVCGKPQGAGLATAAVGLRWQLPWRGGSPPYRSRTEGLRLIQDATR